MMRRPEAYHARLRDISTTGTPGVVSIHEQARAKEEGLVRFLRYDRWPRHSFRVLLFAPEKTFSDYEALGLDESAGLAAGAYEVKRVDSRQAALERVDSESGFRAEKGFSFHLAPGGFDVVCNVALERLAPLGATLQAGLEAIVNFYAPDAPDRYIECRGGRHPLRWGGAVPASELRFVDEWQKIAVTIEARDARDFWISPIETVSDSEQGFERVYQGSQILAVWPVSLAPDETWRAQVVLKARALRSL